jgi:hypothetical protein
MCYFPVAQCHCVNNRVGFLLRSVLCRNSRAYPMSYDFTPVTERQRLQTIGRLLPHLLGQIKCSVFLFVTSF